MLVILMRMSAVVVIAAFAVTVSVETLARLFAPVVAAQQTGTSQNIYQSMSDPMMGCVKQGIQEGQQGQHSSSIVKAVQDTVRSIGGGDHGVAARLERKQYTSSTVTFCWGLGRQYPQIEAHNLFLSSHFRQSLAQIFQGLTLPDEPCFYLHAPAGVGRSKFVKGYEAALGVAGTARNWRTVLKLCDLVGIG